MTETNAQGIRFALVDESGHLTGKPAEGVQAAIAQAVAAIPAWSQTDFDEAMKAHYAALITTLHKSSKAIATVKSNSTSFWGAAWDGTPEIFRRIIETMADMQNRPPWNSFLVEQIFKAYPAAQDPMMTLIQQHQANGDAGFSDSVGRDVKGFEGFVVDLFVAHHALKLMGVDKLEVVGDNLRVTKDGRTGSMPITWDAA